MPEQALYSETAVEEMSETECGSIGKQTRRTATIGDLTLCFCGVEDKIRLTQEAFNRGGGNAALSVMAEYNPTLSICKGHKPDGYPIVSVTAPRNPPQVIANLYAVSTRRLSRNALKIGRSSNSTAARATNAATITRPRSQRS